MEARGEMKRKWGDKTQGGKKWGDKTKTEKKWGDKM